MKTMKFILTALILCSFQSILAQDGKEMIGQIYEYEEIGEFLYDNEEEEPNGDEQPFAIVKYDGKYGVINKSKEIVIPPIYKEIWEKSQGLFPVKIGRKWGFINDSNEIIIEIKYDDIGISFGGFAQGYKDEHCVIQYKRKWGCIDTKGKIIRKFKYVDSWEVPATRKF